MATKNISGVKTRVNEGKLPMLRIWQHQQNNGNNIFSIKAQGNNNTNYKLPASKATTLWFDIKLRYEIKPISYKPMNY